MLVSLSMGVLKRSNDSNLGKSLAEALASGLSLWKHKDARKYLDEVIKLKELWINAYNRDNNGLMDTIELRLRVITETFHSAVGVTYTSD